MLNLPIVVATYNRPNSLRRLLDTLRHAAYPKESAVTLYISIDFSGSNACFDVAENFVWDYGKKVIIRHDKNLGLRHHIIKCGDLSQLHDGIILLEDDLIVSPAYYSYATALLKTFGGHPRIAGSSLYGYEMNEFCKLPFSPIPDGYDAYFMKVPSSWGQVYSKAQWSNFRRSLDLNITIEDDDRLPDEVFSWPETSWKKYYFKHMISHNLYFTYPSCSYSSNMGDIGVHHDFTVLSIRTKISLKHTDFLFPKFEDTLNIYDQFMELDAFYLKQRLGLNEEIEVDTFGIKPIDKIKTKRVFTTRETIKNISLYPIFYHPIQMNLLYKLNIDNKDSNYCIKLAYKDDLIQNSKSNVLEYFKQCLTHKFRINNHNHQVAISNLKKSSSYRLGNFIIKPFLRLKKMLIK
jgi:hypothetical protein